MNRKTALWAVLSISAAFAVFGQEYDRERDFTAARTSDGNSVIIIGYKGKNIDIRVPPQIGRRPVVGIRSRVFDGKNVALTIHNGVTSIRDDAFANSNLTSVTIPDSVTSIGSSAFRNNRLASITIPDSVTSIGWNAFANNPLASVTIPASVISIGERAFVRNQLASIVISNGVISIGNFAFVDNQLATVTIPDSVTSIGGSAFRNNQLVSIAIPDSVTSIGERAFANNPLASIVISSNVATLNRNVFEGIRDLASITIGANVDFTGDAQTPNNFVIYYNGNNRAAGTYTFSNGSWSFHPG